MLCILCIKFLGAISDMHRACELQLIPGSGGTITAVGSESTDILWPLSTNQVAVNLVITGNTQSFQPNFVAINGVNCSISGPPGAATNAAAKSPPLIRRIPTSSLQGSPPILQPTSKKPPTPDSSRAATAPPTIPVGAGAAPVRPVTSKAPPTAAGLG